MCEGSIGHKWNFFRAGGVDQVAIRNGLDIAHLSELDQKLWVALAMPTRGVDLEAHTLELLDEDKDGRIRVPEILSAVNWVKKTLKDPGILLKGGEQLPLSEFQEGPVLIAARRILMNIDRADKDTISLADVKDSEKIFSASTFNGDGVVPPEVCENENIRKVVEDILATMGSVDDRSSKPGIDKLKAEVFFDQIRQLDDWRSTADQTILPIGEATAAAFDAFTAIRSKIDDYFARCRLTALDSRAASFISGTEAEYTALSGKDLSASSPELRRLPLAPIRDQTTLPLQESLNPAWVDIVTDFNVKTVEPLLGNSQTSLTESDWNALKSKLLPYEAWIALKPVTTVEKLSPARVHELAQSTFEAQIMDLIQKDLAVDEEVKGFVEVERLLLYQRDLYRILNNFVAFADFYTKKGAVFQAGSLYLDGRCCNLCLEVHDPSKHAIMAGLSAMYLAYCDCSRPNGEKKTIVAAFTDGDSDNILVGRNGIFYDRKGRDWDATITRIVSNPISIREAFWSPYKKIARFIAEQIAKRTATVEAQSHAKMSSTVQKTLEGEKDIKPLEVPKKIDIGTIAAIGVAVGGIGAMLTGTLNAFFGLGIWMPVGIIAVLLLVSGPSMMLAYLKLRQRNLGPILDASGWAINGRAQVNVPFGAVLTDLASLPMGSKRSLGDPYAEKQRPWKLYLIFLVILVLGAGWYFGKLDRYLPPSVRSVSVLGVHAPASPMTPEVPKVIQ